MEVLRTKKELLIALQKARLNNFQISFVPTMGNLHKGHLALVKKAQEKTNFVIVSIFVNKKQFGQNEDFANYPRTENEDIQNLKNAGVDLVYIPQNEKEVFGDNFNLSLDIPNLTKCLCGLSRPNFFGGILAVLTRLFIQIQPNYAIFGKKDYQQFLIVLHLVESLGLDTQIIGENTVREESGIALSSRNNYLKQKDRLKASFIFNILQEVKVNLFKGLNLQEILDNAKLKLQTNGIQKLDYLEVRSIKDLSEIKNFDSNDNAVLFFAGYFQNVRLIDNLELF
jgi:pantoate--beta-alanine ligase